MAQKYRNLTEAEITKLESNNCSCEDWSLIKVKDGFNPKYVRNSIFSGKVKLGVFEKNFSLEGSLKKHSGIFKAIIHNCEIEDNVLIENIHDYIANYKIQEGTFIQNINTLVVSEKSSFGNGTSVCVLDETGGREVMIHDHLSSHLAYIYALYRYKDGLVNQIQNIIKTYANSIASNIGNIGKNVSIRNAGSIKNVKIGDNCTIEGTARLENGSINSNEHAPVYIGCQVVAKNFIISSGSSLDEGTLISRCFVGQGCVLGHGYSASDSLFFSNCHGENGEACSVFAGPYTVTHHKSTLLIAGMFSFMNAGSGSNQSNHMYKLGPIHHGAVERGGKTTSDSYILWPAKIGAFSLIMGRHYNHSNTSDFPFSYLIENKNETVLIPARNLCTVGTVRDAQKFPKRDKRTDPNKLDQINFNLLSPYTIQKMFKGIDTLKKLQQTCGVDELYYTYQKCRIKNSSLQKGLKLYDMAINKFLGNSIISRLKDCPCNNDEEIRSYLKPDSDIGLGDWGDLSGLLAPRNEVNILIDNIAQGKIKNISAINKTFEELHRNYYSYEWTWAWQKIKEYYNLTLETITASDIIEIVEKWKAAVIGLDKMIYEDTKKEFSLSSQTGFGSDGNSKERKLDFEQVRGIFEENSFVKSTITHIEVKGKLGDEVIARLSRK